jgi:alpha-L-rhamnosidase
LAVEHGEAFGIGVDRPRLSWVVEGPDGWRQARAEVRVDGEVHELATGESVFVDWPAAPLASRQQVEITVRATGEDGTASAWSDPLTVEAGLLDAADWAARLASADVPPEATALLRRSFAVPGPVARARLYATAHGVYEVELNGQRIGDHVLAPGWTSYHHRLRYQTHDVTELVQQGENVLGARLADGWFRGRLNFAGGTRNIYGNRLGLLAQLEVTTTDGERHVVVTDETWKWKVGPTTRASIYDGEDHDVRHEPTGWSAPGFDDTWWPPVRLLERDPTTLVAPTGPPVRVIEEVAPVEVTTSPTGRTIVDFGQNLVGRLRLDADGPLGAEVGLRHAEILEDGELCTEPLRVADARDRFIVDGHGPQTWSPRFTFHGFRYAEVTGGPAEVTAEVCHSDLRRTGWFECSDERVNRLHDNVVWGMRGNFLDVPTDCPQRDERLGWTGDLTAFVPTACFLYDVGGFLQSWLADLAVEQTDDGMPLVVPDSLGYGMSTEAIWGDAATEVPWTLHQRYGDVGILRAQYPSMRRWVVLILRQNEPFGHWASTSGLGDWLDPAAPPENPGAGRTAPLLVANAWFCHTAGVMAQTAELLGEDEDAARYHEAEAAARADFVERFFDDDGTMTSDSQTAHALAIRFGLVGGERRVAVGRRLVELVEEEGHRIGTGFAGTPILCDALCDVGAVDTAYELLLQTECPSWLYPVLHGATTVWERWDGIRPDGTRNPGEMNSFNHYALGAVADWLHRSVAGLAPAEPGYRRLRIRPLPGQRLDHATARHDTPYGRAEVGWRRDGDEIVVRATVPTGTTATVELPDGRPAFDVSSGDHEWRVAPS